MIAAPKAVDGPPARQRQSAENRRSYVLVAAIVCTTSTAQAAQIPAFEFTAGCKYMISRHLLAELTFPECVAREQLAFQALISDYRTVPDAAAMACEKTATKATGGSGSYVLLQTCLAPKTAK